MSDQPNENTPQPADDKLVFEARSAVYTEQGTRIDLCVHASTIDVTVEGLYEMVKYGVKHHKWAGQPAQAPAAPVAPAHAPAGAPAPAQGAPAPARAGTPPAAPQGAPAAPPANGGASSGEAIKVESVSVDITKGQEVYLKVKGGKFRQYGIPAYKELFSAELYASICTWPQRVEYVPPAGMEYATHDGKKVTGFRSTP